MAKLVSCRTSIILLLVTSILIFTACLHLASTRTVAADPISGLVPELPQFKEVTITDSTNLTRTFEEREEILFDGVRRFVRSNDHSQPNLIFLVLTKDKSSWGQEAFKPSRTFHDFLNLITSTGLDLRNVSLGMMTSSEDEYSLYVNATTATPIPRVTVLFKKAEDDNDPNWWTSVPRGGRHSHGGYQTKRRMHVAMLRNELMSRTLHDEQHIIWIDSDIEYLSPNIIQTMLSHSAATEDASIITARCQSGWNPDYDANSWAGARNKSPSGGQPVDPDVPQEAAQLSQKHIGELIKGTSDNDIVQLDSVGGTILYVRANLVHQGLTFPPYYVIGTGWARDGWDGLETEGLCYVARYLNGGGCYTLGGNHSIQHTSD